MGHLFRFLIADDDAGDRKLIARALKQSQEPYECVETASIEEAVQACESNPFDCVLIDYHLPGRDGLSGITALREKCPHIAIIMLTGQGDEVVAAEAIKRGASDYLPKANLHQSSIWRSIESALEKSRLLKRVAQQQEELETFNHLLVHDFKEPLRSVQLFAVLIKRSLRDAKLEEIPVHCEGIIGAAKRAGALIDTLQQYTRAEKQAVFEPVQMNQVMADMLVNLKHVIRKRRARVTAQELPVVYGNAPLLTQLLQNLVDNAIKYCDARPPTVEIAAIPQGTAWRFSVTDNGIGIPEKYYERVFEKFKRLHNASKYDGSGLGLVTCRKIIERHRGVIWCESRKGKGTTFFFTLEGAKLSAPPPAVASAESPRPESPGLVASDW